MKLKYVILLLLMGCQTTPPPTHEHKHSSFGKHQGIILSTMSDDFHIEVKIENKIVSIYPIQSDESPLPVEKQTIALHAKGTIVELTPFALEKDKAISFRGNFPNFNDNEIDIIIIMFVNSNRYRLSTKYNLNDDEDHLFLTPSGKYTQNDISLNGNQTAYQKYKNLITEHDLNPKPGERICPITKTKSNSSCSWVINGQIYTFCCPPCIKEYVRLAKEQPEMIKPPEEYVK